jgi:hypothetical protein
MRQAITDRPCAAKGLISYRYKGHYGWIMIGAKDHTDALNEARRSIVNGVVSPDRLQVWNDTRYVDVDI